MRFHDTSQSGSVATARSTDFPNTIASWCRVRIAWRQIACLIFAIFLGLSILAHSKNTYGAEVVPHCEGETYSPCSSILTSVQVGQNESISSLQGYTRSKGTWTVHVRYKPTGSCAKVKLFVDMGPLDFYREYERVFTDGGGTISDSGTFVHKTDDLASALSVDSSTCFVPDEKKWSQGDGNGTQDTFDDELAKQASELEVQLDTGVQDEPQDDLDKELERLALKEQQALVTHKAAKRAEEEERKAEEARQTRRAAALQATLADNLEFWREVEEDIERSRNKRQSQSSFGDVLGLLSGVVGGLREYGTSGNVGSALIEGAKSGLQSSLDRARNQTSDSQGSNSGGSCARAIPAACTKADARGEGLINRISSLPDRGMVTAASQAYCTYMVAIEVNDACADAFRRAGSHNCANLSTQQADAYRAALPQTRRAIENSSDPGYRYDSHECFGIAKQF